MKLVVIELGNSLVQKIATGSKAIQLYAIRPHLYRHNAPVGSVTVQVQDMLGNVIGSSDTIAISSIGSGTYWHGYQRFLISTMLQKNTSYQIALVASGGYTFSESAYVGWCNDFDLRKVPATFTPNFGTNGALDMEFWETKEFTRRAV